ncbi:hypothetical protein BRADI_1g66060v3 [Brachypodium distachyon]|uniref:Helicase ATP-binding domain-containing protein n=1 Tax=Brachypodium distachyon TaxID=15368 RepID=I1H6S1_BRADI|nr:hypothetical protein BRADI_1g66060v3 [Brachypodium distachyon]
MATSAPQEPELDAPAIDHLMPTILRYLAEQQVVVVSAPPGSGKSSVLPRYLANSGYGPVICAQPRHLAATVAAAKSRSRGQGQGDVVFTTTRRLLDTFAQSLPALAMFGAVVIDEAHNRSTLGTDLLLGMVKAALDNGSMNSCRVVLCTAGDEDTLCGFFGGAPIAACLRTASRPVEVRYSPGPVLDAVSASVDEVASIHASQPPSPGGGVLVFFPDIVHIQQAYDKLQQLGLPGLVIKYVHDNLPEELVDAMLYAPVPDGARKVVLATDVAETAVLVGGIGHVIDTGVLSEEPFERVSREVADRRAATAGFAVAGRGRCHRLYMREELNDLDERTVPRVRRDGALAMFALMLKRHAAAGFEVFDPAIEPVALENAVDHLVASGYLDKNGNLTDKGECEGYDED